jgi:hypothetical protein
MDTFKIKEYETHRCVGRLLELLSEKEEEIIQLRE